MLASVGDACYENTLGLQLGRMWDKTAAVVGTLSLVVGMKVGFEQGALEHRYFLGHAVGVRGLGTYIQLVL